MYEQNIGRRGCHRAAHSEGASSAPPGAAFQLAEDNALIIRVSKYKKQPTYLTVSSKGLEFLDLRPLQVLNH